MNATTESITLTHATVSGREVSWSALIDAAMQDRANRPRAIGDITPPNAEHELADAYRHILRSLLPRITAAKNDAYNDYCSSGVTSRGSDAAHAIGHGSWSSGPDGAKQATWYAWRDLESRIASAAN